MKISNATAMIRRIISAFCLLLLITLFSAATAEAQTTFVVNSTGDSANENPGNGSCSTGNQIGTIAGFPIMECTLRSIIQEANEAGEQVVIEFGSSFLETDSRGISIIEIESNLPYIQEQVTIAGETHLEFESESDHPIGGYSKVFIKGAGASGSGIRFGGNGAGSTIRHISIGGFGGNAILLQGGSNYSIINNKIGGYWAEGAVSVRSLGINEGNGIAVINASGSGSEITQISSNIIYNNQQNGIRISNGSSATFIQNNIIGLRPDLRAGDPFPAFAGNDGAGVYVAVDAGSDNAIGAFSGNTISNNGSGGVHVKADGQTIFGNNIGLPHEGEVASSYEASDYGNDSNGIILESSHNTVGGGGATTNTIGNSQFVGIRVGSGGNNIEANSNEIGRNFIGTNEDGEDHGQSQGIRIDRGNNNVISNVIASYNNYGIEIRSDAGPNNDITRSTITDNIYGIWFRDAGGLVGSTDDPAEGNVIGNNSAYGVRVSGDAGTVGLGGNYIGTDENGADMGNASGVFIEDEGSQVFIGYVGNGNVIGNNTNGIVFMDGATNNYVLSNYIGIHPNGDSIGNSIGITTGNNANLANNQIGYPPVIFDPEDWDPGEGPGNIIAHNTSSGVDLSSASSISTSNVIRGNSIYGNGSRGIDLGMDNIDVGGGSSGPNNLMNYPEFDEDETFYVESTNELEVRYRVRTNASNAEYNLGIDIYLTEEGEEQGKTFLGTASYSEQEATNWVFDSIEIPSGVSISSDDRIVATTTDGQANTSQFSEAVEIGEDEPEIAVSEGELNFGSVIENETETLSFDIENTGEAELSGEVTLADDGGGVYTITGGLGNYTLNPSESMEVEVEFTPDGTSDYFGDIEIFHNADNESSPFEVSLVGQGSEEPEPFLVISEDELDFGQVVEETTQRLAFEIENQGDASLSGEVFLEDSEDVFEIVGLDPGDRALYSINPSESFEVEIDFTPGSVDNFSGLLEIEHNADNESDPYEMALTGEGIEEPEPMITVSEDELDFNTVTEGDTQLLNFEIENQGSAPLSGEVSLEDDGGGVFEITTGSGSYDLDPSQNLTVEIEFSPDDEASYSGRVDIAHNAENENSPMEIALSGEGTEVPTPSIVVSNDELDFGGVIEGESHTLQLEIENQGSAELIGDVSLQDDGDGRFSISSGEGSYSLDPSLSTEVEVVFTPDSQDEFSGEISISHNAGNLGDPVTITLSGEGTDDSVPVISVSRDELDFGETSVHSNRSLTLEIENEGESDLTGEVILAGDDNGAFSIAEGAGDFNLTSSEELSIEVEFAPDAEESYSGLIEIVHNALNTSSPVEITLSGEGTDDPVPHLAISFDELDFDEVTEGESESQSFEIENDGDADLSGSVFLEDSDGGAFVITSGEGSFTLAPSENLEVVVAFNPDSNREFSGQLNISHNADNTDDPAAIMLAGVGAEVTSADELSEMPSELILKQNYPNPFNPSTQIRFELPEDATVVLRVFNNLGQEIATLVDERMSAGSYEVTFNANDLSSGSYIYRLETETQVMTETMTYVK